VTESPPWPLEDDELLGGGLDELGGGADELLDGPLDELGGGALEDGGGAEELDGGTEELLGGALEEPELLEGVTTVTKTTTSAQRPLSSVMCTVMLPLPTPISSTLKNNSVLLLKMSIRKLAQPDTTSAV